jgi:hypothetical protein
VWRDLLIAVPVATAVGFLAFSFGQYDYWRSWRPGRFRVGIAIYLLVNAASGALGVAVAALLGWDPVPGKWYVNGLLFAGAGQALLRVEPRGFGLDKLNTGRSILARGVDFVIDFLNAGVEDDLSRRLRELDNVALFDQALYLFGREVKDDPGIPDTTKKLELKGLTETGRELAAPQAAAARGNLERFCLRTVADRRLTQPQAWKSADA